MPEAPSEALYTVVLMTLKDEPARMRIAQALSSDRLPREKILERLDALPWTLARKAPYKKAYRLAKLLEGLGAVIQCIPPLARPRVPANQETEVLPETDLLSHTQVMSATQFLPRPDEPPPPPPSPPPRPASAARPRPSAAKTSSPAPAAAGPTPQSVDDSASMGFMGRHGWKIVLGILIALMSGALLAIGLFIYPRLWGV